MLNFNLNVISYTLLFSFGLSAHFFDETLVYNVVQRKGALRSGGSRSTKLSTCTELK